MNLPLRWSPEVLLCRELRCHSASPMLVELQTCGVDCLSWTRTRYVWSEEHIRAHGRSTQPAVASLMSLISRSMFLPPPSLQQGRRRYHHAPKCERTHNGTTILPTFNRHISRSVGKICTRVYVGSLPCWSRWASRLGSMPAHDAMLSVLMAQRMWSPSHCVEILETHISAEGTRSGRVHILDTASVAPLSVFQLFYFTINAFASFFKHPTR